MIDSPQEMGTRLEQARQLGKVAVDTELVWERTFYPALGVVQLGVSREGCYLLDAVALEGQMQPLGDLLADADTVKILHDAVHSARRDLRLSSQSIRHPDRGWFRRP